MTTPTDDPATNSTAEPAGPTELVVAGNGSLNFPHYYPGGFDFHVTDYRTGAVLSVLDPDGKTAAAYAPGTWRYVRLRDAQGTPTGTARQ